MSLLIVDKTDNILFVEEKLAAHQKGLLHRAFSIQIFSTDKKRLLLQKRAIDKYHCGGLITNSCCSHPNASEPTLLTAQKRLQFEMGFTCPLTFINTFIYRAEFSNGLIEHELDHVFIGFSDIEQPPFNPSEVSETLWWSIEETEKTLKEAPHRFTPWFQEVFNLTREAVLSPNNL